MNKKIYYGVACVVVLAGIIVSSVILTSKSNNKVDTPPHPLSSPSETEEVHSQSTNTLNSKELFDEIYHSDAEYSNSAKSFIGTTIKDFEIISSNGTRQSIKDMEGKPFILEFMTTSCETCQQVAPELERFRKLSDIPVISVSYDEDRDMLNSATEKLAIDTSTIFNVDPTTDVVDLYKLEFVPTILYVDAEGTIQFALVGSTDLETIQLVADTVLN